MQLASPAMRLVLESVAELQQVTRHWRLLRLLLGPAHPITVEIDGAPSVTFPGSSGRDPER